jgi:hypothetical protein
MPTFFLSEHPSLHVGLSRPLKAPSLVGKMLEMELEPLRSSP